jgi:hypothetical protein
VGDEIEITPEMLQAPRVVHPQGGSLSLPEVQTLSQVYRAMWSASPQYEVPIEEGMREAVEILWAWDSGADCSISFRSLAARLYRALTG